MLRYAILSTLYAFMDYNPDRKAIEEASQYNIFVFKSDDRWPLKEAEPETIIKAWKVIWTKMCY